MCREEQAKAKRLARFHVELSRPVENTNDFVKTVKSSADKSKQATSVGRTPLRTNDDTDDNTLVDMDSTALAAIVGLCPDMCPGSSLDRLHTILFSYSHCLFYIPSSKHTELIYLLHIYPCFPLEPERAERERKGDLDRYERLDGDRNLTTELLAVKKVHTTFLVSWQYDSISFELILITDNKKFDGIHYVIVTV